MIDVIAIEGVDHSRRQLHMRFRVDDLRFATTYWYDDVDFAELERCYGEPFIEKVLFHIAAFEANKLASLQPRVLDLGPYAGHHTERFEQLWRTVFRHAWAQWRFENDLPNYAGPALASSPRTASCVAAVDVTPRGATEVLAFCGGGKDSLVALKLLDAAGIPYASYAYSSSIYGGAADQHARIARLLGQCGPTRQHRQWIHDDFLDSPVLELAGGGVRTLAAAETPASMFAAVPVLLQHGYRYMALAHEASANAGNLIWEATGEDVNHQWGKSLAAEQLLDAYLRDELLANGRYFSLLQPIHDPVIFHSLNRFPAEVELAHSCNVAKPWCQRCPKCAYVYLGYMAYLPAEVVERIFGDRLLDRPELRESFRLMMGAGSRTPFECIGQVDDTRLAFELCRRKGLRGAAIDAYADHVPRLDVEPILRRYFRVDRELTTIPRHIAAGVLPRMEQMARAAEEHVRGVLSS